MTNARKTPKLFLIIAEAVRGPTQTLPEELNYTPESAVCLDLNSESQLLIDRAAYCQVVETRLAHIIVVDTIYNSRTQHQSKTHKATSEQTKLVARQPLTTSTKQVTTPVHAQWNEDII